MAMSDVEDDDDDLQALFKKSNPVYDMSNLKDDEIFRKVLMTADVSHRLGTPKPATAMRIGTPRTAMRLGTPSGVNS